MPEILPLAPRWRRLMALSYEGLLLLALILVCGGLFQLLFAAQAGQPLQFLFLLTVLFGHFAWCWQRTGQTLAMKVWRLKLLGTTAGHASDTPVSLRQVAIRFAMVAVAFLPLAPAWVWAKHHPGERWVLWLALLWLALPYLWAWVDRDRQFLHDRLAGTHIGLKPLSQES